MLELKKTQNSMFNEYYEGTAFSCWKVICILDDNCVMYMVFDANGKRKNRREYGNTVKNKETCFKRATEALNRI